MKLTDDMVLNIAQKREELNADGATICYDELLCDTQCSKCGATLEWDETQRDCGGAYLEADCCGQLFGARPQAYVISIE